MGRPLDMTLNRKSVKVPAAELITTCLTYPPHDARVAEGM